MKTTVFLDEFSGIAGPLSGHTPDVGTWSSAPNLNFGNIPQSAELTNAGTDAASVQLNGAGGRIIDTPALTNLYGYKAVTSSVDPDYAVEFGGTFKIGDDHESVIVTVRTFPGAVQQTYFGVMVLAGADTGSVEVWTGTNVDENAENTWAFLWESDPGSLGDPIDLVIRVEVVGNKGRVLLNGEELTRVTLSSLHTTDAAGSVYLLEDPQNNGNDAVIDYFKIEAYSTFWTEFVQTYETPDNDNG